MNESAATVVTEIAETVTETAETVIETVPAVSAEELVYLGNIQILLEAICGMMSVFLLIVLLYFIYRFFRIFF